MYFEIWADFRFGWRQIGYAKAENSNRAVGVAEQVVGETLLQMTGCSFPFSASPVPGMTDAQVVEQDLNLLNAEPL